MVAVTIAGWLGAGLATSVYAAGALGRLRPDAGGALAANLTGAVGLFVNCVVTSAWPSAALNVGVGMRGRGWHRPVRLTRTSVFGVVTARTGPGSVER